MCDIVRLNCNLKDISPEKVKNHLINHGWKCIHTYPDGISTLWEKGNLTVRHIPDQNLYSDYTQILKILLRNVAYSENINMLTLIQDIDPSVEVSYGPTCQKD